MIKRNLIAAVLVAASLSSLVEAGVTGVTGNDLKKHCHGQNDADVNFCMGYLFGIFVVVYLMLYLMFKMPPIMSSVWTL